MRAEPPPRSTANWSAPTSFRGRKKRCSRCSWASKEHCGFQIADCGLKHLHCSAIRNPQSAIMKILVANLGSTSFKYRLFDMADERLLARGGVERIGSDQSPSKATAGSRSEETVQAVADHAVAVRLCLEQLVRLGALKDKSELSAIGFKAVHAQGLTGVQRVDERVLTAMEAYNDVAPAHNPPYVRAMRLLAKELPNIPLVAAFETGFHESIPPANRLYAVPSAWASK